MIITYIITNILAIALPSLRISPLLLIRIATIALLYAAALSNNVVYIQSIGSGVGINSGLFHMTLISQSIGSFLYIVGAWILMPRSLVNTPLLVLRIAIIALLYSAELFTDFFSVYHFTGEEILLFSVVPVKPDDEKPSRHLTNAEKSQFTLPDELEQILIGLLLGDLNAQKQNVNTRLRFVQGTLHKEYLLQLYERFKDYCPAEPQIFKHKSDKITGKMHSSIRFNTYSLPCFNKFYDLFYPNGQKVVPLNIGELLTVLTLVYWICDDGTFSKRDRVVILCTHSFTKEEVELLAKTLNFFFNLRP